MIVVKLQGRLGNQLFQYAFAYSRAKALKKIFLLDSGDESFILYKYFNVSHKIYLYPNKYVKKICCCIIGKIKAKKIVSISNWHLSTPYNFTDNTYYEGYYASLIFFEQEQKQIKEIYKIRNKHVAKFKHKYGELFKFNKTLVIHIRRTDYLVAWNSSDDLGNQSLALPIGYYFNCLDRIKNLSDFQILVIGDDMEYAKFHFSGLPNVSFEQNDMIVDFQLMINADEIIMSNSTFAWWAAYLNDKAEKIVYAPKHFLGFQVNRNYPDAIYYKLPYIFVDIN